METIVVAAARRLALARAGLLKPSWTGMPARAAGRGRKARAAAYRVIRRFGYLQLDTVSVAGARSHAIVLLSRLEGFDPTLAGEGLVARVDLKADTRGGRLRVLSCHHEGDDSGRGPGAEAREAVRTALERYAGALGLSVEG